MFRLYIIINIIIYVTLCKISLFSDACLRFLCLFCSGCKTCDLCFCKTNVLDLQVINYRLVTTK